MKTVFMNVSVYLIGSIQYFCIQEIQKNIQMRFNLEQTHTL